MWYVCGVSVEFSWGWVYSRLGPFGVGSIRGWVHSGLGPFGVGVHSGLSPIRGWVHADKSPFLSSVFLGSVGESLRLINYIYEKNFYSLRWIWKKSLLQQMLLMSCNCNIKQSSFFESITKAKTLLIRFFFLNKAYGTRDTQEFLFATVDMKKIPSATNVANVL
jgi:hypothetical protein